MNAPTDARKSLDPFVMDAMASGFERPDLSPSKPASRTNHDDVGLEQSNIMNVIDSQRLERDAGGKPLRTFPRPALFDLLPRLLSSFALMALALAAWWFGGDIFVVIWLVAAIAVFCEWQRIIGGSLKPIRYLTGSLKSRAGRGLYEPARFQIVGPQSGRRRLPDGGARRTRTAHLGRGRRPLCRRAHRIALPSQQ